VAYPECPLRDPIGSAQVYSLVGANLSAGTDCPTGDQSYVGDWPGLGVEDPSELRDRPGLGVRQSSELGDSPGEQVRLGLAQKHWPAEHFGQLGERSVLQPLQYSTGTEVVRER